jgi:hypothetical protein
MERAAHGAQARRAAETTASTSLTGPRHSCAPLAGSWEMRKFSVTLASFVCLVCCRIPSAWPIAIKAEKIGASR